MLCSSNIHPMLSVIPSLFIPLVTSGAYQVQARADPWLLFTNILPSGPDSKLLATLGNGQLGVTPGARTGGAVRPSIFVNCVYNGKSWNSHRARIPNWSNYYLGFSPNWQHMTGYTLDMYQGIFESLYLFQSIDVKHQVFVHRDARLSGTIVNLITAGKPYFADDENLEIAILIDTGGPSDDLTDNGYSEIEIQDNNSLGIKKMFYQCEETLDLEYPQYEDTRTPVCFAWTVGQTMIISPNDVSPQEQVLLTLVSDSKDGLLAQLDTAMSFSITELVELHTLAWADLWESGRLEVKGDAELERVVLASQYYLLSSLPSPESETEFCGLSPGSLAYGDLGQDYQGHSFWDTATWMYPPVLVTQPGMARRLVQYRWRRLEAARDYAAAQGWAGARFPWESARTGGETCPDWASDVKDFQHHITGDVSFAVRQYLAVTGDTGLFTDTEGGLTGCEFVRLMAEFWASRVTCSEDSGTCDIEQVMGPDEYHANVNNNVYTNVVAAMAVYFANFSSCVADCPAIPDEWLGQVSRLSLQYDSDLDYHPQYEGYEPGTQVKQADTVLVGYPLMYPMSLTSRENDLRTYEAATDPGGPAMTWGMYAIGYLELGQEDRAGDLFRRSYQPYYHPPFYMWTENVNATGAVNFITGMGGFLQAVMAGYLGLRVRLDRMEFSPVLPQDTSSMSLKGVDYYKAVFDVQVNQDSISVKFTKVDPDQFLVLESKDNEVEIGEPQEINLPREQFVLRPLYVDFLERCPLPSDVIGSLANS